MRTAEAIRLYLCDRYERGLLQAPKLAEAMHLKPGMVNAFLRGDRDFPMHRIDEAAAFLELSVVELVERAKAFVEQQETQRADVNTATAGPRFRRSDGSLSPDTRRQDVGPPGGRERRKKTG